MNNEDFKPMLSATVKDVAKLRFPLYGSPKLDGIRASVVDCQLVSRNLKPIPNGATRTQFSGATFAGMDGELVVGAPTDPGVFLTTTSGVMRRDGIPGALYWVFDCITANDTRSFKRRYADLLKRAPALKKLGVRVVPHVLLNSAAEALLYEEKCLDEGYEGIMLRHPDSPYKFGRGTATAQDLMKLKRFEDAEAMVLEASEQMHNGNEATKDALGRTERSSHKANKTGKGRLGTLKVRGINGTYAGVEFHVGTGWTDAEREDLWQGSAERTTKGMAGLVLTFKYFPSGSKDAPRFPVFKGWRAPGDMS